MKRFCLMGALVGLIGCNVDNDTFTLYRSSPVGSERVHVASFDTKDGNDYNEANCRLAGDLFQQQPLVKVRFWCEKGRFKP